VGSALRAAPGGVSFLTIDRPRSTLAEQSFLTHPFGFSPAFEARITDEAIRLSRLSDRLT
jgi:hypothetical protein